MDIQRAMIQKMRTATTMTMIAMESISLDYPVLHQTQIVIAPRVNIEVTLVNVTNEEIEMLLSEVRNLGGNHFLRKYISPESKFSLHDLLYAFGYKIVSFPKIFL